MGCKMALLALGKQGVRPLLLTVGNKTPRLAPGLTSKVAAWHVAVTAHGEEDGRVFAPEAITG
ncbi:MAG: hypothetical protein R2843_02060 [Thermomicrobiales bacterium]